MVKHIFYRGEQIQTRNSIVKRLLNVVVEFNTAPLVSIKKTPWKYALLEWEWFMSGSNDINDLDPRVQNWWKPWADKNGRVLFNYSKQFRCYGGEHGNVDSIQLLIDGIKNHPYSRRNVITTWNTSDMNDLYCPITNCHGSMISCSVDISNKLHMTMVQRSADVVVGLPANWIQYWAFLLWLAHLTERTVGTFTWIGNDVHIYDVHEKIVYEIIKRADEVKTTPSLIYNDNKPTGKEFKADDFILTGVYFPVVLDRAEMVI